MAVAAGLRVPTRGIGCGLASRTSFCPGSSLLSLASAASFSAEKLDAGAWLSGSAGYFASPGIAFAIELPRAIFGMPG